MSTKYLILFWIIALILFTFYCILRLYYIKEQYDNTSVSTIPNVISYINNIKNKTNITDIVGCENVYDDNIGVKAIGYTNCQNAVADYLVKKYDYTNKYGQEQSLADICPVSTQSDKYSSCLKLLLNKFTNSANMVNNIAIDMNTSINKRIQDRNIAMNGIELSLKPFLYSKDQNDFQSDMLLKNQVAQNSGDLIGLVDNYYKDRNGGIIDTFEGFDINSTVYIIDPKLELLYFGIYKPINGQFLVLNNMTIQLSYESSSSANGKDNTKVSSNVPSNAPSNDPNLNVSKKIILTISNKSRSSDNDLQIIYTVSKLDKYENNTNAIKMILTEQNIISQPNDSHLLKQLFTILGLTIPTQIILVCEDYLNTENLKNKNYKLVNDNLDTILVLEKI